MSLIHKEAPSVMIPKYSMSGPFKGHMSMKSSPLFPGSSCSLSTQFLVQDHMSTHYRKLNSAKAAVDTSAPRSLSCSIKYRDQQNKEPLHRAVEKFKKELQQSCSTSHHHSQSNFPEQDRVNYGHRKNQMDKAEKLFDTHKVRLQINSPVLTSREVMEKEHDGVNPRTSVNQSLQRKKPYNNPQKQTYSGDLLDKHPASFTKAKKPFKPRLLKNPSQSFLSKYRYYTAPTKKIPQKTSSAQVNQQEEANVHRSMENVHLPMEKINLTPLSSAENQRNMEEKYNAMELVFQHHLHRKQPDIDEMKKKILVEELRDELERSVKSDSSINYDGTQYGSANLPLKGNLNQLLNSH